MTADLGIGRISAVAVCGLVLGEMAIPSYWSSLRLLGDHLWLGAIAAVLFAAGVGTSAPVVRSNVRWLMALPLWLVRKVLRLVAPEFPPVRVFLLIFGFNATMICIYMLSGVLVVLPAAIAFLTGLNIGVIVLKSGEIELPNGERPLAPVSAEETTAPPWVGLCSLAVLVLELPSFWISVGMGIGMGRHLAINGPYDWPSISALAIERLHAYWMVIIPVLFVSALAETAAIRGHIRYGSPPPAEEGIFGDETQRLGDDAQPPEEEEKPSQTPQEPEEPPSEDQ